MQNSIRFPQVLERVKLLRDSAVTNFQLRPNEEAPKEKPVAQVHPACDLALGLSFFVFHRFSAMV